MANTGEYKYINRAVCPDGFHRMENGTCMPGLTHPILSHKQMNQYNSLMEITDKYGKYNKDYYSNGSHYMSGWNNPFKKKGIKCFNCVFYYEHMCQIVSGYIDGNALCKHWIIPDKKLKKL